METQPTEMTYAAELKSIIDSINQGFHAEVERKIEGEKLRIDLLLYYNKNLRLIIEVKRPEDYPSLNDQKIVTQAKEYAEHLAKRHSRLEYFGTHNLRHLALYQKKKTEKKELFDFEKPTYTWRQTRPYPWRILPSATEVADFQGHKDEIQHAVKEFLLDFKTALEGKIRPVGPEIVQTVANQLEDLANVGGVWFFEKYERDKAFQEGFNRWLIEHGVQRLRNDDEAKFFLRKLAMEQAYSLTLKLMFYHVLRLKYENLSNKLSDISISGKITGGVTKSILDSLFAQAVVESGDFQIVFETNFVDSLELPDYAIPRFVSLFNFLREVNWRSLDYDIIGTIFEEMIYKQRRHLLGQYFTRSEVVDLILSFCLKSVGTVLDPCVGSGTFLVRAHQRLRYLDPELSHSELVPMLFGIDIDKNVAMLAAINLYIRDPLTATVENPRIGRMDFFSDKIKPRSTIPSLAPHDNIAETKDVFRFQLPKFDTIVGNPPYTRQEEMKSAFFSSQYKTRIVENAIQPVIFEDGESLRDKWSTKSSIYSYFLVKSAHQFLKEKGRLGFITSNSWLDSSFGVALKEYFLKHFKIIAVIESSIERWFEDADINTTILILEKPPVPHGDELGDHTVKFVSLKTPLTTAIGRSPPGFDITEMRNYWTSLDQITLEIESAQKTNRALRYSGKHLSVAIGNKRLQVITVPQNELRATEKWGVFLRAPWEWFHIFSEKEKWFTNMETSELCKIRRGFTTNANELYYLPSKHWKVTATRRNAYHLLQTTTELILPRSIVKPVVKSPTTLKKYRIEQRNLKHLLVYLRQRKEEIRSQAALTYIAWMENYVASEFLANDRFPTMIRKLFAPEFTLRVSDITEAERAVREKTILKAIAKDLLDGKTVQTASDWFILPERDAAKFLCVPGINERFTFYLNEVEALEDKRLYGVEVLSKGIPTAIFFAVFNCSLTYLATELWGRTELGQGALDLAVEDYNAMPILDVKRIWEVIRGNERMRRRLMETVAMMKEEEILPIEKEVKKESRRNLDLLLLKEIVGLSREQVEAISSTLVKLVHDRISRANTIGLNRK